MEMQEQYKQSSKYLTTFTQLEQNFMQIFSQKGNIKRNQFKDEIEKLNDFVTMEFKPQSEMSYEAFQIKKTDAHYMLIAYRF